MRLIDANALIKSYESYLCDGKYYGELYVKEVIDDINSAPTINNDECKFDTTKILESSMKKYKISEDDINKTIDKLNAIHSENRIYFNEELLKKIFK